MHAGFSDALVSTGSHRNQRKGFCAHRRGPYVCPVHCGHEARGGQIASVEQKHSDALRGGGWGYRAVCGIHPTQRAIVWDTERGAVEHERGREFHKKRIGNQFEESGTSVMSVQENSRVPWETSTDT